MQGQRGLDQSDDAGRAFEVAQVALDRSDEQGLVGPSAAADDRSESGCFDGVSQQGPRPVRFDVVDVGGVEPRVPQGVAQQFLLRRRVGCHEARRPAVLVHGGTPDDGEHPVAVAPGVGETLEHDDAAALTTGDAVRRGVEGLAPAVRGQRTGLFERCRDRRRQEHVDPRGQCRVALPAAQTATGQMHGYERRRTGRVDGDAGAAEIEQVGHAVGDDAAGGSGTGPRCQARGVGGGQLPVLEGAQADEDAGAGGPEGVRGNAGVVQRLAGDFEHQPLLGVHDFGLAGRDAEEVRVEALDVVEEGAPLCGGFHQGGGVGRGAGEVPPASRGHLADRVRSCQKVLPERVRSLHVRGQTAADADDRDGVVVSAGRAGRGRFAGRVRLLVGLRGVGGVRGRQSADQLSDRGVFPQQRGGQRPVQ